MPHSHRHAKRRPKFLPLSDSLLDVFSSHCIIQSMSFDIVYHFITSSKNTNAPPIFRTESIMHVQKLLKVSEIGGVKSLCAEQTQCRGRNACYKN